MAVDFVVDAVMTALGLEGNEFQRPTIEFYVDEVNEYLKDAGVPEDVIGTKPTVGIVARGVADLWSYGAGNGKLSVYFKERAIQLASTSSGGGGGGSSDLPPVTPADDGKVLTVVDGQWSPLAIPAELPEVTAADNGKALRVVNGAWEVAPLPPPTPGENVPMMVIDIYVTEGTITRIYDRVTGTDIAFSDLWSIGWQNVSFVKIYGFSPNMYGTPLFQMTQYDGHNYIRFNLTTFVSGVVTRMYVDQITITQTGSCSVEFSSYYDGRPI